MANRLHTVHKRTRDDYQLCKDCKGNGSVPDPERPPRLMNCATCSSLGAIPHRAPYRLADGTWSDGMDRSKRIDLRQVTDRYEVTVRPGYFHVWHSSGQPAEFYSFAEAIAYADHHARTTKNGDA